MKVIEDVSTIERSFEVISSCIDTIFTEEEAWAASDCTKKELTQFLEGMQSAQFKMIEDFFTTMYKLSHTFKVKNPKTGVESGNVGGLTSFFALIMGHISLESYYQLTSHCCSSIRNT